jgi:hypothetical protein
VCSASTEEDALTELSDVVVDGPPGLAAWLTDLAERLARYALTRPPAAIIAGDCLKACGSILEGFSLLEGLMLDHNAGGISLAASLRSLRAEDEKQGATESSKAGSA